MKTDEVTWLRQLLVFANAFFLSSENINFKLATNHGGISLRDIELNKICGER